jgi:AraC family transcriptional regulator of adaptative response/methylated-DNA-[protein]-cysteine methyltransferase
MMNQQMPAEKEMQRAMMARDTSYDGVFIAAVRTTGIFCRPSCPARKPRAEHVEFYPSVREALAAGYRPCKRCRPLEPNGTAPQWLRELVSRVEEDPTVRWTDADLREMSIDPARVRRWFKAHYGMTFHAYQRARRLGLALGHIRKGGDLTFAAFDYGYESLSGFREAFDKVFGVTPGRSRRSECIVVDRVLTPLGPMLAGAAEEGICLLEFTDRRMLETQVKQLQKKLECAMVPGSNTHLEKLGQELERYFSGDLREFTVDLVVPGTEFQKAVWERLRKIPYGETLSYEQLARDIGRPGGQRAVGQANGLNRIAIVIPCHRVIRADGSISGYGGGVWRKRFLLEHEKKIHRLL